MSREVGKVIFKNTLKNVTKPRVVNRFLMIHLIVHWALWQTIKNFTFIKGTNAKTFLYSIRRHMLLYKYSKICCIVLSLIVWVSIVATFRKEYQTITVRFQKLTRNSYNDQNSQLHNLWQHKKNQSRFTNFSKTQNVHQISIIFFFFSDFDVEKKLGEI